MSLLACPQDAAPGHYVEETLSAEPNYIFLTGHRDPLFPDAAAKRFALLPIDRDGHLPDWARDQFMAGRVSGTEVVTFVICDVNGRTASLELDDKKRHALIAMLQAFDTLPPIDPPAHIYDRGNGHL